MKAINKVAAFLVCTSLLGTNCTADEISFLRGTDIICIKGTTEENSVSIVVKNNDGFYAALYEAEADENGEFSAEFKLGETLGSGTYTASAFENEIESNFKFRYINEKEAAPVFIKLEKADNFNEFKNILLSDGDKVGLSQNDQVFVNETLYGFLKNKRLNSKVFLSELIGTEIIYNISKENSKEALNMLSVNAVFLEINENDFFKLATKKRENILEQLNKLSGFTSFKELFDEASFLGLVNTASGRDELREIVENTANFTGINLSDFKKIKYPENVLIALLNKSDGYSSSMEFKKKFDSEVLAQQKKEQKKNESSSSGGGTNSGGRGIISEETHPSSVSAFSDAENHWCRETLNALYNAGCIEGTGEGNYEPDRAVTRAEFAKMFSVFFKKNTMVNVDFSDVDEKSWYAPYIYLLASNGVIKGMEDGRFLPDDKIKRCDAAVIAARISNEKNFDINITREYKSFSDEDSIPQYAINEIKYLYERSLINGSGNNCFNGNNTLTRAEAAQILFNLLKITGGLK